MGGVERQRETNRQEFFDFLFTSQMPILLQSGARNSIHIYYMESLEPLSTASNGDISRKLGSGVEPGLKLHTPVWKWML